MVNDMGTIEIEILPTIRLRVGARNDESYKAKSMRGSGAVRPILVLWRKPQVHGVTPDALTNLPRYIV